MSLDVENGIYVETTILLTTEASTEVLFAGPATIALRDLLNFEGELVGEENSGVYEPSAVDGRWEVTLTNGPEVDSFLATGTGTGELSGRSIEFDMEPLPEGCGYTSSGTIR